LFDNNKYQRELMRERRWTAFVSTAPRFSKFALRMWPELADVDPIKDYFGRKHNGRPRVPPKEIQKELGIDRGK
jgi:hypothetical protein